MITFNYKEATNNFSEIIKAACKQDVIIRNKNGMRFKLVYIKENSNKSPFDVEGIDTNITTAEMINLVKETRLRN